MALTRRFLASKGIEADVIDEIITAHTETISGLKDSLDELKKFEADAKKYEATKKELDELKAEVAKNSDKDFDKLQKEFDDYKAEVEGKAARNAKESAFKALLKDIGIPEKHYAKILKYSDVDGIQLDDDGKIVDAKDLRKSIKDDWSDHIETQSQSGARTANPPSNTGGGGKTKEEILQIKDTAERQKAILENPQAFGIQKGD